jgi:hypothetical protein
MKDRGAGELERDATMSGDSASVTAASPLPYTTTVAAAQPIMARAAETKDRAWNTRALSLRLGADAVAAVSAGVLVAPTITIIDQ